MGEFSSFDESAAQRAAAAGSRALQFDLSRSPELVRHVECALREALLFQTCFPGDGQAVQDAQRFHAALNLSEASFLNEFTTAHVSLCLGSDRLDDAVVAAERAVQLVGREEEAHAYVFLARCYFERAKYPFNTERLDDLHKAADAVEKSYRKAVYSEHLTFIFEVLNELADPSRLIGFLKYCLTISPQHEPSLVRIAYSLIKQGRGDDAQQYLSKLNPATRASLLSMSDGYRISEAEIRVLSQALKGVGDPFYAFPLARGLDQQHKYAESWRLIDAANATFRETEGIEASEDRLAHEISYASQMGALTTTANYAAACGSSIGLDFTPIFVVGLPRSGKSLVSRLLASNAQLGEVLCGGEMSWINRVGTVLEYSDAMSETDVQRLVKAYNRALRREFEYSDSSGAANFIVDDCCRNFLYLPYIFRLFPSAKVVHVTRNLEDTAFEIYAKGMAPSPGMGWVRAPHMLGAFINRVYRPSMQIHAQHLTSQQMISVNFEDLCRNPESVVPKIFDFCGIPQMTKNYSSAHHARSAIGSSEPYARIAQSFFAGMRAD